MPKEQLTDEGLSEFLVCVSESLEGTRNVLEMLVQELSRRDASSDYPTGPEGMVSILRELHLELDRLKKTKSVCEELQTRRKRMHEAGFP